MVENVGLILRLVVLIELFLYLIKHVLFPLDLRLFKPRSHAHKMAAVLVWRGVARRAHLTGIGSIKLADPLPTVQPGRLEKHLQGPLITK